MSQDRRNRISVVIAAYQGERYIREQLESVLQQTRVPDEVLIGDDGSTDHTPDICENVMKEIKGEKPEMLYFKNEQNLGYAGNFYSLMRKAMGDILFLCDQDDVWESNKVETMAAVFESHPEVLALSTSYSIIDENGKFLKKTKGSGKLKAVSLEQFLRYPAYPGMAMAFRKELMPKVLEIGEAAVGGFVAAHDWAINFSAACGNGMYYLDEVLTRYRRHSGNTSAMLQFENKADRLEKRKQLVKDLLCNLQAAHYMEQQKEKGNNIPESDKRRLIEEMLPKWSLFEQERIGVLKQGKLFPLVLFEINNRKYTALRPALGDLYAVLCKQGGGH